MNKEEATAKLIDNSADLMNWIKETGSSAVTFASNEIPATIHEFIVWVIIDNLATVVGCLLCYVMYFILVKYTNKLYKAERKEDNYKCVSDKLFTFSATTIGCTGVVIAITFSYLIPALTLIAQCIFSPRIIVIEKIAELVK